MGTTMGMGRGLGETFDDGGDESYTGGGTKDAFLGRGLPGPAPASKAACRSDAYRS
jgi:hypothetical protein